jgi:membrane-bound lytic murein transglycosylase B
MVRFGSAQKASTLLPLAVLSAAWTAGLATTGSDASAAARTHTLPDGTRVPAHTVNAPASLTPTRQLNRTTARQVVRTASASGIPAAALAAYQRAATVIDAADRTCHLPWQLVAAIGRVESDHGRADGNVLTDKGVAKPGIFGPQLDGTNGTVRIRDTDAGQYDGDATFDRAVGPMQFIPSTWAIVGVDADNDGQRNPHDIYDAALASAVYLCSGPDDLSTRAGRQAAILRYNHSQKYVALVLAVEKAYLRGDYASVPNGTTSTTFSLGGVPLVSAPGQHAHHAQHAGHTGQTPHTGTGPGNNVDTHTTTPQPSAAPTGGASGAPSVNPSQAPTSAAPTKLPSTLPTKLPTTIIPTTSPTLLTRSQAVVQCLAQGLVQGTPAFDRCVYDLTH